MAIGTYGVVRPSDVRVEDIDIYYNYMADRYTQPTAIVKIPDPTQLISTIEYDDNIAGYSQNLVEGLYNLTLPATFFNNLGIYTLYFKPKMTSSVIVDCSVLSALPTVKGIVLDISSLPSELRANNSMQGYRVEYVNSDGTKRRNTVRYIITSNRVSPVSENVGNTSQKAIRYRFDDNGTLVFLQLTPSSSSDVKPNVSPFIGEIGQIILISNTFFSPLVLEIDLVQNTIDTLTNYVAGEQIKDVNNGILTYYGNDRAILKQFNLFEIKNQVTDVPLYEVKEERTTIDTTQNFNDIVDGLG
jgi:hypothetical protein